MFPNPKKCPFRNFDFSNSEIRGLIVLTFLMITLFMIPRLYHEYLFSSVQNISQREQQSLIQWIAETKPKLKVKPSDEVTLDADLITDRFDPNTINANQWETRGFSEKVAKTIRNYLDKGGRFYKKEDVLKIYGINQDLVKSYFSYMSIASRKKSETVRVSPKKAWPKEKIIKKAKVKKILTVKLDLNQADTTAFQTIHGIGPYYSKKLVKYRDELGGFIHEDQLLEIYGIDTTVQKLILENTTFLVAKPKQINLNTASFDTLLKHPYLDYRTTRSILKYKKQHGPYQSVEDLKKILTLKDSIYLKVKPYLKVIE